MKRDVQTLRLHVLFWWAMQDSNLRQLGYENTEPLKILFFLCNRTRYCVL